MKFDDYRALDALNWSSLKMMGDSPLLYRWRQEHPRPDTAALSMGRAIHVAVLEPAEFGAAYREKPADVDYRTKSGKAWRDEATARGVEIITPEQSDTIVQCCESIASHADASALLSGTRREETIRWTVDGVACKGRVDAVNAERVVDLKTCRDLGKFERDAASFCYHGQLAWYLDGAIAAKATDPDAVPYIVAVETSEPYDCAAFRLSETVIDAGRYLWRSYLDRWVACRDADLWPGRHPSLEVLDLPPWAPGMRPDEEEGF